MKKIIKHILIRFILFIASFTLLVPVTEARWASLEDTDVSMELFNRNIEIHKDGSYVETIELVMKATKESGKDRLVSLPLTYDKKNSSLKILQAKTILHGKEYPVDLKNIEDKPLASSPKGFDENNQVLIAFPQMALDAKAYIKYQNSVKKSPLPGFFSTDFIFGADQYWQASHVHVFSELPLYVKINDPDQILDVKQSESNNKYQIDIVLQKPVIKLAVDERDLVFDGGIYPWVTISTMEEWPKLGALFVEQYEAVLGQKLPILFEKIAAEAKTKSNLIEKINTITARLSENITYMGEWRTVKGAFVPRDLNEIVSTKLGDCKDFSASTVAILRHLGIKADVALVNRGIEFYKSPNNLPNLHNFNHAFVRVQESQETYWVDPTNFTSFAQGIYPDVADRSALVLDPKAPVLAHTKNLTTNNSAVSIIKKVTLPQNETELSHVTGKISMIGTSALPLIGADLRASKESINRDIIRIVADESRAITWKINDYDLRSRIAKDLTFHFDFSEKHTQLKTTAGQAYVLDAPTLIFKLLAKTHDRVTGLRLEIPSTYRYETLLPKRSLIGSKVSNCTIESPWVKGSRKIANTAEGIQVLDELVVKKDKILNSELRSKEYAEFQNTVYGCFGSTALVYQGQ